MINDSTTYQAVRVGDVADWRLICVISSRRMCAYLKHTDPTRDLEVLFDESWRDDSSSLLSRIENLVYDHPQVLDDFSADIIIVAPHTIWVPTSIVEDDEEQIDTLFNRVYEAEPQDISASEVDDATALFSLLPGLNAFLQRTFPGARIHSHLAVMAQRFRDRSCDMTRVYIDVRDNEADFIAFDHRNLLMGATHTWHDPADIQYHLFNIMNVYNLDPRTTQVSLSGIRDIKNQLIDELRKQLDFVMLTMLPTLSTKVAMPLAGALMLRRD